MRQSRLSFAFLAVSGVCFVLGGCGGNTSDTAGSAGDASSASGSGPVASENLAHEAAVAQCSLYSRCNPDMYFSSLSDGSTSPDRCVSYLENVIADQSVAPLKTAMAAGKTTYDGASERACLDALSQVACDYSNAQSLLAPCAKSWNGTVPIGGSCNSSYECAGGASTTVCSSSTATCPGVCTAQADVGGSCSTSQDCLSNLECDMTNNVCEPLAKVGDACGSSSATGSSCGGLAQCVQVSTITGEFQCADVLSDSFLTENAICGTNGTIPCAPGLTCTLVTSESTATNLVYRCQKLAALSAPCQYALGNPCPDGQFCPIAYADALTGSAQCTPQLGVNQPCTGNYTGECSGFAQCRSGICVTPPRIGESCSQASDCYSNNCQNGLCAVPPGCNP